MTHSSQEVICAFLEVDAVSAELYLNGFPVLRANPLQPMCAESVHPFLVDGPNTVELLVATGPTPSTAREPHQEPVPNHARALVWLAAYQEGMPVLPEQGQPLMRIHFLREQEPIDLRLPASKYGSFDLGKWRGSMIWQQLPALGPAEGQQDEPSSLLDEAYETLDRIIEAHQQEDLDAIFRLFEPHLEDFQRIFRWTDKQLREHVKTAVAGYGDDPDAVLPWKPEDTDFRLVAYRRLIECINRDWLPTMRVCTPSGQILKKPIYLGRYQGELRVIR